MPAALLALNLAGIATIAAVTEFWVTGCLLAAHLPATRRLARPWLLAGAAVAFDVDALMWK